ncbi:MAG TPA: hypothetical protein VLT36_04170, partial [Candidatus Dormibacteraeota bacterium]|nr:hypothetical protein [Candidatus Dormibacteraeota bacterium]
MKQRAQTLSPRMGELSAQNLNIAPDVRKFLYHDPFRPGRTNSIIAPRAPASPLLARLEQLHKSLRPTPHVPLTMAGMELFAKLEYANPIGSLKDRPAFWILKRAAERGEIG